MSSRVLVVAFIEVKKLNYRFVNWPNHITLLPYFNTHDIELLSSQINLVCKKTLRIPYDFGEIDYFGSGKNIKVSKIISSKELKQLHKSLLKIAIDHDELASRSSFGNVGNHNARDEKIDLTYCGDNYNPHMTHNEDIVLVDTLRFIDKVYLIRKINNTDKDKVVERIFELR